MASEHLVYAVDPEVYSPFDLIDLGIDGTVQM